MSRYIQTAVLLGTVVTAHFWLLEWSDWPAAGELSGELWAAEGSLDVIENEANSSTRLFYFALQCTGTWL